LIRINKIKDVRNFANIFYSIDKNVWYWYRLWEPESLNEFDFDKYDIYRYLKESNKTYDLGMLIWLILDGINFRTNKPSHLIFYNRFGVPLENQVSTIKQQKQKQYILTIKHKHYLD
jgi:hypothetical protein